jgi:hypothetical protein
MDGNNFLDQIFAFRIVCIHKIFIVVVNSSASFKQCINAHRQNEFLKKTDEDDIPPSVFLVVFGLLIGIVFYVMSLYVSEFRIVMSATISVLNYRFSFASSCL